MEQLACWAANHSEEGSPWLQQLLALPLDSSQEEALVAWLQQRQAAGDHLALALPLACAQRGRLAEALWHYTRWGPGAGCWLCCLLGRSSSWGGWFTALLLLVACACDGGGTLLDGA